MIGSVEEGFAPAASWVRAGARFGASGTGRLVSSGLRHPGQFSRQP